MTEPGGQRKRRPRRADLYVEWLMEADVYAVLLALRAMNSQVWEVDEDVDIEHWPQGGVFHPAAVFRVTADRELPVHELLIAVAELPCVYSVCEMSQKA